MLIISVKEKKNKCSSSISIQSFHFKIIEVWAKNFSIMTTNVYTGSVSERAVELSEGKTLKIVEKVWM